MFNLSSITHVDVLYASGGVASAAPRRGSQRQVVTVDNADVVEVLLVPDPEGDLEEGRRGRGANAVAFEPTAAVSGLARASTGRVERAAGPGPHPARPSGSGGDRDALAGIQLEPCRGERRGP